MDEIKAMLTELAGTQKVETNNLNHIISFADAIGKENMYFLWGVVDNKKRNKDDDIKKKCYVFVDIDIRSIHKEKTGEIMSDEVLDQEIEKILKALKEKQLDWRRYAVHSGNWLHLYYVGKEAEIDKTTYSKGVQVFYNEINQALQSLGYVCDKACHNIARISRLPWSINSRYKFALEPMECKILHIQPNTDNGIIELLPAYAEMFDTINSEMVEVEQYFKKYDKSNDDIRWKINSIDIAPIVCDHLWLKVKEWTGDIISLCDKTWNIGAYIYKPYNVVKTTGTTRLKKDSYTTYEFVLIEICRGDKVAMREYFESKYQIEFSKDEKNYLQSKVILPNKKFFEKEIYRYPDKLFDDEFEWLRSGELVLLASPTNTGKTMFAQWITFRNKDKHKCLYINLEFDLERGREDNWKRARGMKVKIKGSKEDPYTPQELEDLTLYISKCRDKMQILDLSQGTKLETICEKIYDHMDQWYSLFVVDTFSSIEWADKYENQNIIIRTFHDICKITWACIILVHHFNKSKIDISGSQKLSDLSNVVIILQTEEIWPHIWVKYTLVKDKAFHWKKELVLIRKNWKYSTVAEADLSL